MPHRLSLAHQVKESINNGGKEKRGKSSHLVHIRRRRGLSLIHEADETDRAEGKSLVILQQSEADLL